jgi:hypothetical protein
MVAYLASLHWTSEYLDEDAIVKGYPLLARRLNLRREGKRRPMSRQGSQDMLPNEEEKTGGR